MKNKLGAALLIVLFLLLFAGLVAECAQVRSLKRELAEARSKLSETPQAALSDGTTRSSHQTGTPEHVDQAATDYGVDVDAVKSDAEKFGAKVTGVTTARTSSKGQTQSNIASSASEPRKDPPADVSAPTDPFGYQKNAQTLQLDEKFGELSVPIGSVKFSAWEEKPWSKDILPRSYRVASVLATDESGKHQVYTHFQVEVAGKKYDLPVEEAKTVETLPEASFRFAPKLSLGLSAGVEAVGTLGLDVQPGLQISFFSYGRTKILPNWFFLGVGPGISMEHKSFSLLVTPASFNLGSVLPLIDNLYVGPTIGLDASRRMFALGTLSVQL